MSRTGVRMMLAGVLAMAGGALPSMIGKSGMASEKAKMASSVSGRKYRSQSFSKGKKARSKKSRSNRRKWR